MKGLWIYIDEMNRKAVTKIKIAWLVYGMLAGLAGLAVWLLVSSFSSITAEWSLCFIGFPVIISYFAVLLYATKKEFHDGSCTGQTNIYYLAEYREKLL